MSGIDYYRILGVPASATGRAIREAYLGKVRSLHPDRVGPEGTALFQQITEAYDNLSDPEKRREYDRTCRSAPERAGSEPNGMSLGAEVEPLVGRPHRASHGAARNYSHDFRGLSEYLFCYGAGARTARSLPEYVEFRITLARHEALRGVVLPLAVPVVQPCPWCSGRGETLYRCRGCGGSGKVVSDQDLRIQIQPGIRDGSVIDVPLSREVGGNIDLRLHIRVQGETVKR